MINPDDIILCENVRYQAGEKKNDETLSQRIANLCDVYVMDAFGASHRNIQAHMVCFNMRKRDA